MPQTSGSKKSVKFYNLSPAERRKWLTENNNIPADLLSILSGEEGLDAQQADHMIENVIGVFSLPLGIAQNFVVNGREVLVPMAIEEPSVVAGASFMAKLALAAGGFTAHTSDPEMIAQIQVINIPELQSARLKILEKRQLLTG